MCQLIKNNIVAIADASIGIAKFYEFCVLKMKTGQMMRGLGMSEPTDEQLKQLEDEFMEEIEDLNNEDKPKEPYTNIFLIEPQVDYTHILHLSSAIEIDLTSLYFSGKMS